jgi:gas vesicle protein
MNNSAKIMTALGFGLAAGAVAGILLAPRKGSETREILLKKGSDLRNAVKDKVQEGLQQITSMGKGIKDRVNGVNEKIDEVLG